LLHQGLISKVFSQVSAGFSVEQVDLHGRLLSMLRNSIRYLQGLFLSLNA
jgi:hypothetical protein